MTERYDRPGWGARIFNGAIRRLAEAGISIQGSTAVQVRGRRSGRLRGVVVNVLTVDGRRYLVSPRGNTQWARNARAAGEVEVGPRRRARRHRVAEVPDDAKPDLFKPYLDRWYWQVKGHIGGLTPRSSREEMRRAAASIPVFELVG
ncbi:nitroreductase/quinone reductase family protein [Mycolicibacterium sp. BiH015]|uniref:nitroreductase/quinone reductase family protein n=1 Tax=Mycolicibacterium sp. BiH015 TaxID=3018808 RepID=UPI0022DF8D1E|nr:nitroreductase/quinone reductase family protein [Mycolicibacterium sp. BiH015]MDA2893535.1 nitroreductase/quinone reductase family protein [Mycolicibacterium sp. BiH015]